LRGARTPGDIDDELVALVKETFSTLDAQEEAVDILLKEPPTAQIERSSSEVRLYVAALETELEGLESEIGDLCERIEGFEELGDTPWYEAAVDAEVETFGEEAGYEIDWGLLVRERARVQRLEAVARDALALEEAARTGNHEALRAALAGLRKSLRAIHTSE